MSIRTLNKIIQEKLYNEYGRWNKVSWEGLRMIRNFLLTDSDWTQMPDAVLDADTKAMWTKYRAKKIITTRLRWSRCR